MTEPQAPDGERTWRYRLERRTAAPPEVVWPLIAEAENWRDWAFLTRSRLLREGAPDRNGVGALRRFAVGPIGSCEEVVAYEPPSHLGYVARRGLPVRSYRADIRLAPDGDGTSITWSGTVVPKIPGTGRLALEYTHGFVKLLASELVRHADRLVAGP